MFRQPAAAETAFTSQLVGALSARVFFRGRQLVAPFYLSSLSRRFAHPVQRLVSVERFAWGGLYGLNCCRVSV